MKGQLRSFAADACDKNTRILYATARATLSKEVAARERRTRARANDRQERDFYRQDTADILDMAA